MLLVGRQTARTCTGIDRRAFLQVGRSPCSACRWPICCAPAPHPLRAGEVGCTPVAVGRTEPLDTFDLKPNATLDYRGPFGTIPTRVTGARFCELFPARRTDRQDRGHPHADHAVERSRHRRHHRPHRLWARVGRVSMASRCPVYRARARFGGREALAGTARRDAAHPFFVIGGKLHQGKKAIIGEGGGPLAAAWDPFRLEYDPALGTKVPASSASRRT